MFIFRELRLIKNLSLKILTQFYPRHAFENAASLCFAIATYSLLFGEQ